MGEATADARRLREELMAERVDPPLNRPLCGRLFFYRLKTHSSAAGLSAGRFLRRSFRLRFLLLRFPGLRTVRSRREITRTPCALVLRQPLYAAIGIALDLMVVRALYASFQLRRSLPAFLRRIKQRNRFAAPARYLYRHALHLLTDFDAARRNCPGR